MKRKLFSKKSSKEITALKSHHKYQVNDKCVEYFFELPENPRKKQESCKEPQRHIGKKKRNVASCSLVLLSVCTTWSKQRAIKINSLPRYGKRKMRKDAVKFLSFRGLFKGLVSISHHLQSSLVGGKALFKTKQNQPRNQQQHKPA